MRWMIAAVAPVVMALLPLGLGLVGRLVLGLLLFGVGLLIRPAVRQV